MKISTEETVTWIEYLIADTEFMLEQTGYSPKEKDYEINEEGKKVYTDEWRENMPVAYSTLLGKHSALVDLRKKFKEADSLDGDKVNERNLLLTEPRNN